jgi:hypothetical protein
MKICTCGKEIKEEQTICFDCFKKDTGQREISFNEIVFDVDNREVGFEAINFIGINLYNAGYNFEIYYAEGQKSPHLHIKNIPHLEELNKEQLEEYKKAIIQRYTPSEYLPYADLSIQGKHLIAQEGKPHFKYKTIKKLLNIWNEDKQNFVELDIYNKSKQDKQEERNYNPNIKGNGITAQITARISIIKLAKEFGLQVRGNKCLCPFHNDSRTPSLVFYENQGRFHCFGCRKHGNIIVFYALMKKLIAQRNLAGAKQ